MTEVDARELLDRPTSGLRRLVALGATMLLVAGCGIAGQSPTPAPTGTAGPTATVAPTSGSPSPTATAGGSPTAAPSPTQAPSPTEQPSPAGQLDFANWPLYIDIDDSGAYPTLDKFTAETGISVRYLEDINDNEEFFGLVQPDLAAGNPTGYDLMVFTDWTVERMIRLGYLEPLDHSLLPTFAANAQELYLDPWYDPGNVYSIPYQSGITGIAYNPTLTGREITSFDDLFDPEFAGRAGIFSEMRDTLCLTLLSMGVEPVTATIEQVQAAQQKLLEAAQRNQFRSDYGNDYYDALAAGDLAITIAWSGDISQMQLYDNADVRFVVPETGGMLWVDNMVIPKGAAHPIDAHAMMDFWYDVENATALTEYIGYFTPVSGVAEQVLEDAQTARDEGDEEWAAQLEVISQTAFPSNDQLQNVYTYPQLTEEEERTWNDLFNEVIAD